MNHCCIDFTDRELRTDTILLLVLVNCFLSKPLENYKVLRPCQQLVVFVSTSVSLDQV